MFLSSTNRGYNRHKSDYYVTPIEQIKLFVNYVTDEIPDILNGNILDHCAGGDNKHDMSYPTALQYFGYKKIATIDARKDSLAEIKTDYLTWEPDKDYDVVITNPPFNIALPIIKKALNDVKNYGYVIMLLRLNFFGSKRRFDFWQRYMPKYVYVHHKRMSFTDDGSTDSIEYAHFVWQKGNYPEFTKLKVI